MSDRRESTADGDPPWKPDPRSGRERHRALVIRKPIVPVVFLDAVPTRLPAGRVFVHDAAPQTRGGTVRFWHVPAGAKRLRVCGCALAPSLGIHFKAGC